MTQSRKTIPSPAGREFQAGDFYSFRTKPVSEFGPQGTGRYAAVKILGFRQKSMCVAVLDGVFGHHPSFSDVKDLPVIRRTRFQYKGDQACSFVVEHNQHTLDDMKYCGNAALSKEDAHLLTECNSYSAWSWASAEVESEWRWKHDRVAFTEEVRLKKEARLARMAAERQRQKTRLRGLTWEMLLTEKPLSRWDRYPLFPPPEFTAAAREQIHSTVRALQALGAKPRRPQVREILKSCVDWFNAQDAEFGNVIETEEREDICAALDELAYVARQRTLTSEIDDWRHW